MGFKIIRDLFYPAECMWLLEGIVNGKPIYSEEYFTKNIRFNVPGFESDGRDIADVLFTLREGIGNSLVSAIFHYEQFNYIGVSKELAILNVIAEERSAGTGRDFIEVLDQSPMPARDKYDAVKLWLNFDRYYTYTQRLMAHTADVLRAKVPEFAQEIKSCMDFVEHLIREGNAAFLKEKFKLTLSDDVEYIFYPSLFNSNEITMHGETRFEINFFVGMRFFDAYNSLNEAAPDTETVREFLKCVCDNTKFTIMKSLQNNSLYGSQLAKLLNCTTANISLHMSDLVRLEAVTVKKDGKRNYYRLNREKIEIYMQKAAQIFSVLPR